MTRLMTVAVEPVVLVQLLMYAPIPYGLGALRLAWGEYCNAPHAI